MNRFLSSKWIVKIKQIANKANQLNTVRLMLILLGYLVKLSNIFQSS